MSMSPFVQPLHIFRKDARHLWPETLISLALLAAYAWAEVQTWLHPINPSQQAALPFLLIFLVWVISGFLLVIWLVLTSRLVHDEELVGDRQFWITRPYTWYSLLSSKILYLIVLVGLPFIVMQMWLLHHANLYPTQLLPDLAKNLLIVSAVFLLPLLAIASVTATFVRYMLSVLAGVIYVITTVIIVIYNWSERLSAPFLGHLISGTLLVILLAALVLQYARRKTMIARILLLTIPLVFVVMTFLVPSNLLSERRYPDVAVGKLTFIGDVPPHSDGKLITFEHKNLLYAPLQVQLTNMPQNSFAEVQRVRVDLDGPNGFHYSSDWAETRAEFSADETSFALPFALPEKVFEQVRNQPVALHFQIGTQTFSEGTPYTVTASEKPFPIPGHANCIVSATDGSLECHFPFGNRPNTTLISATVHDGTCQAPGPDTATAYGRFDPPIPWPLHFSPVNIERPSLSVGESPAPLCAGTPVTFKTGVEGAYGRMRIDIPSITLDAYAARLDPNRRSGTRPRPTPPPPAEHP